MKTIIRTSSLLIASLVSLSPVYASADCSVVNLMPAFWQALANSDSARQMRSSVVDPHPDVYNDKYVDVPSDTAAWADELARDKSYVEAHRAEVDDAEQFLAANVPYFMKEFRKTFPDFRCDFTFYIAPSFGHMDGSAATVNGQHRIIFAPDVIPRLHKLDELKVLIDHETFHIYHHQATNLFGASDEAVPSIETALWTEGLATFVSWKMNPSVTLDLALLQPGIPEGTNSHLANVATQLLAHLEEKNEREYARFFMGGKSLDEFPRRAGYYIGFLIANKLLHRHTLQELARMKGSPLHDAIVSELERLQTTPVRADALSGSQIAQPVR